MGEHDGNYSFLSPAKHSLIFLIIGLVLLLFLTGTPVGAQENIDNLRPFLNPGNPNGVQIFDMSTNPPTEVQQKDGKDKKNRQDGCRQKP